MKKDLLSIKELSPGSVKNILKLTARIKRKKKSFSNKLKLKTIGLIFEKPSNRTRVSFEVGVNQLGGNSLYLDPQSIQLKKREALKDVASTLSRYLDGIVLRTFSHKDQEEFAQYFTKGLINGLSDLVHPCQALADMFTVKEKFGRTNGVKFAYVGDGNNVCNSLILAAGKLGVDMHIATPPGYEPDKRIVDYVVREGASLFLGSDPYQAVKDAQVVYTDVWVSMGQESERTERLNAFKGYQINEDLLKTADKNYVFMHCLPAHRGEEVADSVIDGPHSIVFDQAENRLHTQKAVMVKLFS